MIDPPRPPSMICCAPAITVFQVPVTLTSITSRKASGVMSFHAAGAEMPALATMMSSRPSAATPSSTASRNPSRSRVSTADVRMRRPVASTRRAVSFRSARRRRGIRRAGGQLVGEIDRDDVGTLDGQPDGVRAALPPGRAGDERDLAGEPWPSCLELLFTRLAADDEALDLAGALVEPQQPDVAVDALDRNVAHVAGCRRGPAPRDRRPCRPFRCRTASPPTARSGGPRRRPTAARRRGPGRGPPSHRSACRRASPGRAGSRRSACRPGWRSRRRRPIRRARAARSPTDSAAMWTRPRASDVIAAR